MSRQMNALPAAGFHCTGAAGSGPGGGGTRAGRRERGPGGFGIAFAMLPCVRGGFFKLLNYRYFLRKKLPT